MPPRIGPMHGVQPNANATPTRTAPRGPAGLRCECTRFSVSRKVSRNTPIVCSPNTMRTAPAILLKSGRRANRNLPTAVAEAPSATNTSENPITNATEVMNTCSRDAAGVVSARISSSETPDTKEMKPAAKAANSVTFCSMLDGAPLAASVLVRFLQLDRGHGNRRGIRPTSKFDGRQVLEHDVPLPPL